MDPWHFGTDPDPGDPYQGLTDPDSDPVLFVSSFKAQQKIFIFKVFFLLITF